VDVEDGWYHVMNRGADRRNVFFDDTDRIEFGARLADLHGRFGVETHAYCLMDNHYHVLLHCPAGGLSPAMQRLGSLYTRHVNDRLGRDGALFRGRFHSRVITGDAHLLAAARYIHRNPLDLPGVDEPDGYRWSSHRTYLGLRARPPWMVTSTVLGVFAGDTLAFDHFVAQRPEATNLGVPTIGTIRAVIETAELVLAEKGLDDRGRIEPLARSLALAWARDAGVANAFLLEAFDLASTTALHSAVSRARSRVRDDDALVEATRSVLNLLSPSLLQKGSDP
jgi:REP element-mobilizing transposase RayT